ncbi:MAG: phosphodiester glycosidase family protein [Bacteroidales bacterium]|nr:phosphodiester glycosidase family protein [Bacteroidales bacterium]
MKKLFFIAIAIVVVASCQPKCDDANYLTFKNANWEVTNIDKGITLKQYHFQGEEQIFESSQYISIIEMDTKAAATGRWALANDPGKITRTSKFAADSGAIVAMNGTFYNMSVPYNSVSFFRKYGELCYEFTENMGQRDNGAVAIRKNGQVYLVAAPVDTVGMVLDKGWANNVAEPHVMGSGPLLMMDGKDAYLNGSSFNQKRHPRSALATSSKKVYLITVDGRAPGVADGMTLPEFTKIMRYVGAEDALNMDGGGSTTLYVKGMGVVNHPSDNKKFDKEGERYVVNSLLFIK